MNDIIPTLEPVTVPVEDLNRKEDIELLRDEIHRLNVEIKNLCEELDQKNIVIGLMRDTLHEIGRLADANS